MTAKPTAAALVGLILGICVVPLISHAQSTTPTRPAAPTPTPGRFQLVTQPGTTSVLGLVYLIDTATGRVWAHIQVTPSDEAVAAAVRNMPNPQGFTTGPPLADQEKFRRQFVENYGPCSGTSRCFVELDRVSLTNSGWVSEVVGKR